MAKHKPLTPLELNGAKCKPRADKPKGHRVPDQKGLYVFVTPKGLRVWRLTYRFAGKQKTLVIGTYPEIQLSQARKEAEKARADIGQGIDPAVQKQLAVETLGD